MNKLLRGACLATYLLAAIGAITPLPFNLTKPVQYAAGLLLAAHALEALVMFKYVKRYPGGVPASLALTLLFGVLHWLPLRGQSAAR